MPAALAASILRRRLRPSAIRLATILLLLGGCWHAYAVPSFARQTGLACSVCHSNPPELTAFGRLFKLRGYVLADTKANGKIGNTQDLFLSKAIPISAMVLMSDTASRAVVPGSQNNSAGFPQQLSLFLAGEFAPHFGGMAQFTYTHADDHFSMDNADFRYARERNLAGSDWIYGVTLNNNPTVEDVWNSTPAWGFPWISGDAGVGPLAAPIITGLGGDVAGVGAYSLWNNHLYTDVTLYRSEHAGGPVPVTGAGFAANISGVAPYWRVAWQQTWGANYLEVGTYGLVMNSFPGAVSGLEDRYVDPSFDFQYERPMGANLFDAHGTFIHESQRLGATFAAGAAANPTDSLNTLHLDGTFHWRHRYTATGGYFQTTGQADSLLYAPAAVTGSNNGSPDSNGYIAQFGYWPVQNIDLTLAYTGYWKFNGARQNYDGAGRSAADNNTVYLALWLAF